MTPVAVKLTAVSIQLLTSILGVIERYQVDSGLLASFIICCLSSFHREAQQHQQSYISWMKMLTVSELDGIL